jgi:hypothetical protein
VKLALALLGLALMTVSSEAQVQVLIFGEIRKIDAKAGALIIRERVFSDRRPRRAARPPDLGPGFPPAGRNPRSRNVETKVLYSSDTQVKTEEKTIAIGELKVGDSVRLSATPGSKGLVASEISRLKAAP